MTSIRTLTAAFALASLSANAEDFPKEPLMVNYPVLGQETLTHVYDYDWFSKGAKLDLPEGGVKLCDYEGGEIRIKDASFDGSLPSAEGYNTRYKVTVKLEVVDKDGNSETLKDWYTYCNRCGRIERETPVITLNGSEDGDVTLTYGDKLDHRTDARIEENGGAYTYVEVGGTNAYLDGSNELMDRDTILAVGRHSLRVVSVQIGNNIFSPTYGPVRVGFKRYEKTFDVTIIPRPTCASGLSIESRKADGTTRLGKVTLPKADNVPDGGEDPMIELAEVDSSQVKPEQGTYDVSYRMECKSANYTLTCNDWQTAQFTITAADAPPPTEPTDPADPAVPDKPGDKTPPSPETDPDFFSKPMAAHGDVLTKEQLTQVYDYEWFANGGEIILPQDGVELCGYGDGRIGISGAYIGTNVRNSVIKYPKSYEEEIPVLVSLFFVDDKGIRYDIDGIFTYCDDCGRVCRNTPKITINGSENEIVSITYGETVDFRTDAEVTYYDGGILTTETGGIEARLNGDRDHLIYKEDLLGAGVNKLTVVSRKLGNDNLDPTKGIVVVGYGETLKDFVINVARLGLVVTNGIEIEPRPADGTTRLGKVTMPEADNAPEGGEDPEIDVAEYDTQAVKPEPGTYEVRYRLKTNNQNYYLTSSEYRTTYFTITPYTGPDPSGECASGVIVVKFGNTLAADNSKKLYTAYQWTADGEPIPGATKQYYHAQSLPQAVYSVILTKTDGTTEQACPVTAGGEADPKMRIIAHPYPASAGEELTIRIEGVGTSPVDVSVYGMSGEAVATRTISGDSETRLTLPKGLFAIRAAAGSQSATMKIVAK